MSEAITDIVIDELLEKTKSFLDNYKENKKWRELFIATGSFLIKKLDSDIYFERDLYAIFSDENMQELSRKLKSARGYNFRKVLYDELYDLMARHEVSKQNAETYIHYFMQAIFTYLEQNDPDKYLEAYLSAWKKEETEKFSMIQSQLDEIIHTLKKFSESEIVTYTISDIDTEIRKQSIYKGMNLEFFDLDDEQFSINFQAAINDSQIFVVGKSREETLYRILNEINNHYQDRVTIIVKSKKDWEQISDITLQNSILIPFFYDNNIVAIPNNTNIFIYGEDEPCYHKDKLVLHKRTTKSIRSSLELLGIESNEAYRLVENTHGLYVPLRKRLFRGAIHDTPRWVTNISDTIITALLCGKWTSSDGDRIIFEELAGKKYEDCIKEIEYFSYGENPFVLRYSGYHGDSFQLACVEDAWEELDVYITADIWNKFINLFYEVLIESEPLFEFPFEKHFEASLYAQKPEWSPALKNGMIRTLIMRAYYRGHEQEQNQIDYVIKKVLDTITSKERWGYISQYFTDLCEASPSAVIDRLEEEVNNPTGMKEVFSDNQGDLITGRNYYTHILWSIEHLLQQKKYVGRAVRLLFELDSYSIEYKINNSPRSVLSVVFCAWLNASALSVAQKIQTARWAVQNYKDAWSIVANELPTISSSSCMPLSTPKFREIDEPDILYTDEVTNTYCDYLTICVDTAELDVGKWITIIDHLCMYGIEIQVQVLDKLVSLCSNIEDIGIMNLKDKIKEIIYRHRYFKNSEWSMDEDKICEYEKALDKMKSTDPIYEYLYLFRSSYNFPLLHPIPYDKEETFSQYHTANEQMRMEEIKEKIKEFKAQHSSLEKLIDYSLQDEKSNIGFVLGEFYSDQMFDEDVFKLLLLKDKKGNHAYNYIRAIIRKGEVTVIEILQRAKTITSNEELLCDIISLQVIENCDNAIIFHECEPIKKLFWSKIQRAIISLNADISVYSKAIDECFKYGSLEAYIELLYEMRKKIPVEQLYSAFVLCPKLSLSSPDSMFGYNLENILKLLQKKYLKDNEKCPVIAQIEWFFRNILNWEQMKCMQFSMKIDPTIYAQLVYIIYKNDSEEPFDEKKAELATRFYTVFEKAKFCPAEIQGKVDYAELEGWIQKFKDILIQQKQERLWAHLIGRLLAYSPIGEDGFSPCESVRKIIEKYYSDELKNSFSTAEYNKRGAHFVDAGRSELLLSEKYQKNAEALQNQYPYTAEIYFSLSRIYRADAVRERELAENGQ